MIHEPLQIDPALLRAFESQLDPRHPEASAIPARVLGYGEISTVFELGGPGQQDVAYKRMPIFQTQAELQAYQRIYLAYNQLLEEEIGLHLPAYGSVEIVTDSDRPVLYLAQRKLDPSSLGHRLVHRLATSDVQRLVRRVLQELAKVWRFNTRQTGVEVGLDGQISNWAVSGWDSARLRLAEDIDLQYVDTSTPLFRLNGQEQLNPEFFLRGAPPFLAWLLKALFVEDVVGRYYDLRQVTIDLIANFYKEQLGDLVPLLVDEANSFLAVEAPDLEIAPIGEREVRSYYRQDAMIWRLYQGSRRIDRFLRTRLLGNEYPYILPEIEQR